MIGALTRSNGIGTEVWVSRQDTAQRQRRIRIIDKCRRQTNDGETGGLTGQSLIYEGANRHDGGVGSHVLHLLRYMDSCRSDGDDC